PPRLGQRLLDRPGVALDPRLPVPIRGVPRVRHQELGAQRRTAPELRAERRERALVQPLVRCREVDEVGVVHRDGADPVLPARRVERRDLVLVQAGLRPLARRLREELEHHRTQLRRALRRTGHAARGRDVRTELVRFLLHPFDPSIVKRSVPCRSTSGTTCPPAPGPPMSSTPSSRSHAAAATSTSWTKRPASSASLASSTAPSTTRPTTASSRARSPMTTTRST